MGFASTPLYGSAVRRRMSISWFPPQFPHFLEIFVFLGVYHLYRDGIAHSGDPAFTTCLWTARSKPEYEFIFSPHRDFLVTYSVTFLLQSIDYIGKVTFKCHCEGFCLAWSFRNKSWATASGRFPSSSKATLSVVLSMNSKIEGYLEDPTE